jgi:hypothetical protein
MEESIKKLMNENNRSFYPSDMFEFIHHPKYGCCDLKGLNIRYIYSLFMYAYEYSFAFSIF